MKARILMLAALPAMLLLPTVAATSSSAQYASNSQPELAQSPVVRAPQESIKLPFLKSNKTPIPDMSESSAVRMACGGSPSFIFQLKPAPKSVHATPVPTTVRVAPASIPVHVAPASIPVHVAPISGPMIH